MLTRIDHVGIACHHLADRIAFYESTFGLVVVNRELNEDQGVNEAMLRVADAAGRGIVHPAARAAAPGYAGRPFPGPPR